MIRRIATVGGLTLVSRLSGFIRDVVMAAVLGAGPMADAFFVAFRRANHGGCGTGPCFRPVRRASNAPTDPSASSWQGLLVAPEGAPTPPECLVATRPAGAAPRPASRRLMKRP